MKEGIGNTVFDKPFAVERVRVKAYYPGHSSNFIVYCGDSLTVNELIGDGWGSRRYNGVHKMETCGEVEIVLSTSIEWSFTEVR